MCIIYIASPSIFSLNYVTRLAFALLNRLCLFFLGSGSEAQEVSCDDDDNDGFIVFMGDETCASCKGNSKEDSKPLLYFIPDCPFLVSIMCDSLYGTGRLGGGPRFFTTAAAATSTDVEPQNS